MSFILSKMFWGLAAPGNLLTTLLVLGVALQLWRRPRAKRLGRGLVTVAAVGFLALAALPVGDRLMAPLENRFAPPILPDRVDGIIVLGGALVPLVSAGRDQPAVNQAADRMIEFAGLARRFPEARLVFSGGSGLLGAPDIAEAPVARAVFDRMGLDTGRILFEGQSRNTWENVLYSQALARPQPGERWVVVTSAFHMPRAVGIFRRAGWPVLPYPVDYRTNAENPAFFRFDLSWGLDLANDATREWIGLAAYRLMGRTDALFPGPTS